MNWVTKCALILAVASFLLFAAEVVFALIRKPVTEVKQIADKAGQAGAKSLTGATLPSIDDFSKLLSSMASLVESLSKAGPSLTSVMAAVLFLLIAAISNGAFQGPSASSHANPCKPSATQKCDGK
jgi:hypothetical protein